MQTIASAGITFQPVADEDEEFLFRLYSTTRAEEVQAWGWPEAEAQLFLKMQFTARQRSYQATYPNATYTLVLKTGEPIGQEVVERGAKTIRLIDIALVPAYRGTGIGTLLLNDLIEESRSSEATVELKVLRNNVAAIRLYERMGFVTTQEDAIYKEMIRNPE
jgi:ribosomal protein S18 acetylase RimI-like enzyme